MPATSNEGHTLTKLVEIISDRLEWPTGDEPIGPDTPIGEEGLGFDSLMVVELALDIEENFGLEIDEEKMLRIGGMTLADVVRLVDEHQTEPPA